MCGVVQVLRVFVCGQQGQQASGVKINVNMGVKINVNIHIINAWYCAGVVGMC